MSGPLQRLRRLLRRATVRQAAIYFASSSLRAGLAFLLLPVLAALLGPRDFGLWTIYRTLLLFLIPVLGLSLHAALGRSYYKVTPEQLRRLVHSCLMFLLLSTLAVLALLLPALLLKDQYFGLPAGWLWLLPLAALLSNVTLINQGLLRQEQRPWSFAGLEVTSGVLPFALGLVLIWLGMGWQALAIGIVTTALLTAGASLRHFRREGRLGGPLDRPLLRQTLAIALPLIPHTLGSSMLVLSDRLVLEHFTDATAVGIYGVGYTLATALQLISLPFNNAWSPWAFRLLASDSPAARLRLVRAIYAYFAGIALLGLAWWQVAPLLLDWFFAPDYAPAAMVIGWIVLGVTLAALHSAVFPVLLFAARTRAICLVTLSAVAVNLGGCFLLIPDHGMLGAAWATAASYLVLVAGQILVTQLLSPLPWLAGLATLLGLRRPPPAA